MIPIRLREILNMVPGREYELTIMDKDGRQYVCIDCGPIDSTALAAAIKTVESAGLRVLNPN